MPQSIGAASAPKVHTLFHLFSPGLVSRLICYGTPQAEIKKLFPNADLIP